MLFRSAIRSVVAAPVDGRIVADVIGGALVFRARVAVITIGDDKAAILFRRIFAVACVEVAHLKSARIAIVARRRICRIDASRDRITNVVRAHVAVVTIPRRPTHTVAAAAGVVQRARVAVIALRRRPALASSRYITGLLPVAPIAIVALLRRT